MQKPLSPVIHDTEQVVQSDRLPGTIENSATFALVHSCVTFSPECQRIDHSEISIRSFVSILSM